MKISQDVAQMLELHDKLVMDIEQVIKLVLEDMNPFKRVLDVANVYKLRSERQSKIARQWLGSDAAVKFMTNLSSEMMNNGALAELEKFKLVARKTGVDLTSFWG